VHYREIRSIISESLYSIFFRKLCGKRIIFFGLEREKEEFGKSYIIKLTLKKVHGILAHMDYN
jgi:hypothetical protein